MHRPSLRVQTNGHITSVNLTVCPVTVDSSAAPKATLYLAILEEAPASPDRPQQAIVPVDAEISGPAADAEARIASLKQELQAKDDYLQSAYEELESSNPKFFRGESKYPRGISRLG